MMAGGGSFSFSLEPHCMYVASWNIWDLLKKLSFCVNRYLYSSHRRDVGRDQYIGGIRPGIHSAPPVCIDSYKKTPVRSSKKPSTSSCMSETIKSSQAGPAIPGCERLVVRNFCSFLFCSTKQNIQLSWQPIYLMFQCTSTLWQRPFGL